MRTRVGAARKGSNVAGDQTVAVIWVGVEEFSSVAIPEIRLNCSQLGGSQIARLVESEIEAVAESVQPLPETGSCL